METVLSLRGFSYLALDAPKDFFGNFFAHLRNHFIPHHTNNYLPHVLSSRLTSLFAILLLVVKIFTLSYVSLGPIAPAFSSAITGENVITLTNQSRASFGLKALTANSILSQAAQAKADDMAGKGYFAHNSVDGKSPWDFIQSAGYSYIMAGENLAVNFLETENLNEAWMNSPSHKANILNNTFEEIGIGISEGEYSGRSSVFVVQMFGTPAEEKIVLKNQPPKVELAGSPLQQALLPEVQAPSQAAPKDVLLSMDQSANFVPAPFAQNPVLAIEDVKGGIQNDFYVVKVKTSSVAVKVIAVYGQKASMLMAKEGDFWQAQVSLSSLTQNNQQLILKAFDINGRMANVPVAIFAPHTMANYNFLLVPGQVAGKSVQVFGQTVNLADFEHRFYLVFLTAILASLILAIAIKRHIQHPAAIANGSFVAILAVLLWTG